jgi:hypothetical protein
MLLVVSLARRILPPERFSPPALIGPSATSDLSLRGKADNAKSDVLPRSGPPHAADDFRVEGDIFRIMFPPLAAECRCRCCFRLISACISV